ncbi:hypothetical protein [Streptomyces triticiradicis]|uniref:Lipoprotein n=1 Tax=Streptomyces triticiradicis TaxID=2651189 RepID=A0A7J5DDB0_9ACTN|nr:hypothetical protein [Streptomyces triticiradicis]KAB1986814.1 hypothetical protein F8144_21110 [Streptomyces triticiradicis]
MNNNKSVPAVIGLALACLTACSGTVSPVSGGDGRPQVEADYSIYASAEEVTTASDIAITAAVLSIETRECDDGGESSSGPTVDPTESDAVDTNPDPSASSSPAPTSTPSGIAGNSAGGAQCMPMVFLKVRVSGMMKRGFGVNDGDEIIVGNIDTDAVSMEGTTPIAVGKQYALYLTQLTASDHPGITSVPTFWIPVGGNQGIFTLGKGTVQPASANIVGLTAADAEKALRSPGTTTGRHKFATTVSGLKKAAAVAAAKKAAAARKKK